MMRADRIAAVLLLALGSAAAIGQPGDPPPPVAAEPDGSRIVGGSPAAPGSAPWQAELFLTSDYTAEDLRKDSELADDSPKKWFLASKKQWELKHRCGGVYLGDDWVMTAAHCTILAGNFMTDRSVRLGTQNLERGGAVYRIERAVVHAGFRNVEPYPHDIALVKIARAGPLPPAVAAIRLLGERPGDRPLAAGDQLRATGWGLTKARASGKSPKALDGTINHHSPVLMQVPLTLLADQICDSVPDYAGRVPKGTICVGSAVPGRDACNGDSGGPLTRLQGHGKSAERVLVGIVSWGRGCALAGFPGIYTQVSQYRRWIERARAGSKAGRLIPVS